MRKMLCVLCMMAVIFTGCKKDEDGKDSGNGNESNHKFASYIQYDGKEYEVTKAFGKICHGIGEGLDRYIELDVVSSSVDRHTFLSALTGTGTGLRFCIFVAPAEESLPSRTYGFGTWYTGPYTMWQGGIGIGCDYSFGPNTRVEKGTLKMSQDKDQRLIEFEGKDINGKSVKCYYKGTITYFNEFENTPE